MESVQQMLLQYTQLPAWMLAAFAFVVVFALVKLLAKAFIKKSKVPAGYDILDNSLGSNGKQSTKKKHKLKRQKASDSNNQHSQKNGSPASRSSDNKASTHSIEQGDSKTSKKSEKKKGKSKKKKSSADDSNNNSASLKKNQDSAVADEGEWRTVSTKEQRQFMKRVRKQNDSMESVDKEEEPSPPSYHHHNNNHHHSNNNHHPVKINYIPSMPASAKDVAPRFARAAGEEWNNGRSATPKRNSSKSQQNSTSRGAQQPITSSNVVESLKWNAPSPTTEHVISHPVEQIPAAQNLWNSTSIMNSNPDVSFTWSPIVQPSVESNRTWPEGLTTTSWPMKTQMSTIPPSVSSAAWENDASTRVDQWGSSKVVEAPKVEDWVHVQPPTRPTPVVADEWVPSPSVYSAENLQHVLHHSWGMGVSTTQPPPTTTIPSLLNIVKTPEEEFILEPEGRPATPPPTPPLAEDDPWNFDSNYDKNNEAGDWSQPEASWCNTNSDWSAPTPVVKKSVTYDESSDDETKVTSSTTTTNTTSNVPNNSSVVGAGPDMLGSNSKKSRRRRKKKQASIENNATEATTPTTEDVSKNAEDDSEMATTTTTAEVSTPEHESNDHQSETPTEETTTEEWAKKPSKKKRARKEE